jgi:hypothetical protein
MHEFQYKKKTNTIFPCVTFSIRALSQDLQNLIVQKEDSSSIHYPLAFAFLWPLDYQMIHAKFDRQSGTHIVPYLCVSFLIEEYVYVKIEKKLSVLVR